MGVMLYKECFEEDLLGMELTGSWVSMPKVDGDNFTAIQKQIKFSNGSQKSIRLVNRHDNDYTKQFPEIVSGLGIKKGVDCIVNGEIAYWDNEKKIYDFNLFRGRQGLQRDTEIMRRRLLYPCKFYVFDLIKLNGEDMVNNPNFPFKKRYEILKDIIIDNNVTELLPIREDLLNHFQEECESGREGIMLKNIDNIYIEGRTKSVLKCKNWNYSIIDFTTFEDNNAGITLSNKEGDRVLVAGHKSEMVRALIIQSGVARCKIRHLQGRTINGRLREPTFKEVENEV